MCFLQRHKCLVAVRKAIEQQVGCDFLLKQPVSQIPHGGNQLSSSIENAEVSPACTIEVKIAYCFEEDERRYEKGNYLNSVFRVTFILQSRKSID